MQAHLSPSPKLRFYGRDGKPLSGGYLITYDYTTSRTCSTWADADMKTMNPFQIQLDANGEPSKNGNPVYVFLEEGRRYKFRWFDSEMNPVGCVQPMQTASVNYGDNNVFNYYASVEGTAGEIVVAASVDPETGIQTFFVGLAENVKESISSLEDDVQRISDSLSEKKDMQEEYEAEGASGTKTIKSITQDENGEIKVEFQDIEFPQQVPNVEITSPNDTIDVQSSVDPQTNTKTFEIDVKGGDVDETWAHFENSNTWTSIAYNETKSISGALAKTEGTLTDSLTIPAGLYDFKLELAYRGQELNAYDKIDLYIEYGNRRLRAESFLFDNSIEGIASADYQTEWSGGIFKMPEAGTISISAKNLTDTSANLKVSHLFLRRVGTATSGGSGSNYTEGDGIKIENGAINVNYGSGLEVDPQTNKLKVKIGKGLKFDEESLEVEIDNDVSDVVETVEKLEQDLDTQLTVNFDMANITHTYDFADSSVTTLSNGATMLCQAFAVPINHEIRVASATEDPTLLGIYAKQPYATKIMLALYVYDFETGYTDYVADTGPVTVKAGRNEFPLVHINPNISELKSSCVYYAALYLPSSHNNGLYLASCANYATASYINATPRFSVGVQNITYNGSEIDMTDATTGRLDYNDGNGNYYIGPWSDGYNERPDAPRFFMQLRNGAVEIPVSTDPFTDIGAYTLKATSTVQDVFGSTLTPLTSGVIFQAVEPAQNVTITEWTVYDTNATDSLQFGGNVFPSDFDNQNMVSQTSSCTVTELGEIGTGAGIYGHKYTPNTPIQLSANTTYRFPACVATPGGLSNAVAQYDTPTVQKELHLFESGYNVSQWATYSRANNVQGTFLKLKDSDNNEYVI